MDTLEKQINCWVVELWADAERAGTPKDWMRLRECLYGALQASNWAGAMEQYDAFSTLASVAHERGMMAYEKYQEAA